MMTDSSMLKYQYDTILDQLILLQLHAESPDCPCSLQGIRPGELGEFCEPKHLRSIVALARETIAMEEDRARLDYLENLVLEGSELLAKMELKLCEKEVDLGDIVTWSRDIRKPLEEFCYSGFCAIPKEEAIVEEVARMFRKKAEPRWCYPVKETDKELSKLSRTLGAAKKRIAEIKRHLEMPLNICSGQAEMFESTTGVLDPYGSRCRDPKTGQWVFSEECGYEPAGITTTALGMDGLTRYEFEFKIVSADKLIISHNPFTFTPNPDYPAELQPRLRERAATKIQVEKIAANLEPDAVITDFHVIDRGTPIVGQDLVVEAGNGRVMGIIMAVAYHPEKYSNYKQVLSERARDYGLSPKDVDAIKNPILVRVRITDVDRTTFAQEANQAATIAPSAIENARTDAQKITQGMLQELVVGDNESLEDALRAPKNQAFAKRFLATLPENAQAALVDAQGYLNRDGVHRMAMAVFVSAFQGDSGLRLAEKAFESVDMDVRNTVNAIARSLGPMAQAEALTRTGERDTALSIGDDLAQTVNVYSAIKRNPALTVEKYLAQEQIFARELTPFQESILVVLEEYKRAPRKLASIFTAYAEGVIKAPPPAQAALMPGVEITKEGLWESAVKAPEPQPALMEIARMFKERCWKGPAYRAETGYRHDPGQTAGDVVRYEQEELGNDYGIGKDRLKYLDRFPAHAIKWVARSKTVATHYNGASPVDVEGHIIIAEDGDGGYLVLDPGQESQLMEVITMSENPGDAKYGLIPAVKVEITRAEGLHSEVTGKPEVCTREAAPFSVWSCADHILVKWSNTAPKEGGYDKCDFMVTWEDGETYEGRYDLKHHTIEYPDLAKHIHDFLMFHAGLKKPLHMSAEEYRNYLSRGPASSMVAQSQQFLQTYEVGALNAIGAELSRGGTPKRSIADVCKEIRHMLKEQPWGAESMLAWAERLKVLADAAEGCESLQKAAYTEALEVIKIAKPMLKPSKVGVAGMGETARIESIADDQVLPVMKEYPGDMLTSSEVKRLGKLKVSDNSIIRALDYLESAGEVISSPATAEKPKRWAAPVGMGETTTDAAIWLDPYVIKYIAQRTEGKSSDEVVHFYVDKLIFQNPGYLEHLVRKYDLPKHDILKIDAKIQKLAKKSISELSEEERLEAPMMLLTKELRDKLPPLYSQEKVQDPMVWVKFFTPDSNWTWYATEFDGDDTFFGWVVGFEKELGLFSLKELESARGPMGLPIERDKWFTPMPLSEVKKLHQHERGELGDEKSSAGFPLDPRVPMDINRFYFWIDKTTSDQLLTELCERADYLGAHLCLAKEGDDVDKEWIEHCPYIGTEEVYSELGRLRFLCFKLTDKLPSSVTILSDGKISLPKEVWEDASLVCMGVATDARQRESLRERAEKVVNYIYGLREGKLAQGTMGAIGAATITGIGIGAGFKLIDWLAKTFTKKEGELAVGELPKDLEVTKRTFADGVYYAYDHAIDRNRALKRAAGYRLKGYKTQLTKDPGGGWLIWIDEASFLALFKTSEDQEELEAVDRALDKAEAI